jgi:hypothetical protein
MAKRFVYWTSDGKRRRRMHRANARAQIAREATNAFACGELPVRPFHPNSLLKNLEIGALAAFLPRVLGRSGCCEQTLTYAVSSLGMRIRL